MCERASEQGAIVKQAVFEEGEEREWLHIGLAMAWAAAGGQVGRQQAGGHASFIFAVAAESNNPSGSSGLVIHPVAVAVAEAISRATQRRSQWGYLSSLYDR